ncbi:Hypothetical protein FKW44_007136 [Caligus rogercresseyi]|uniref:Uncharacterized protein n=1 Tax=Caligus rogercresseyi TaxID=217165 RepID=A0A7T8KEC4_CALRO|nr:Hypothetical protein FKW44_007136 [Caligus rogercresseyi]
MEGSQGLYPEIRPKGEDGDHARHRQQGERVHCLLCGGFKGLCQEWFMDDDFSWPMVKKEDNKSRQRVQLVKGTTPGISNVGRIGSSFEIKVKIVVLVERPMVGSKEYSVCGFATVCFFCVSFVMFKVLSSEN